MKLTGMYLFILFSFVYQSVYSQDLCNMCDKLKNNVVQITATFEDGKEENGFGTVIAERDNQLYIVTAKHVIYNLEESGLVSTENRTQSVTVKFFYDQGKDYAATLLKLPNSTLDISLLEVEKPNNYSWTKDFYSKAIPAGTKVWFIGRSGKWYIPTGSFVGSINDVSAEDEILIDINSIQPGTSGAPLISPDGMVGILFEDASGGAKAYTIEKVMNLITRTWNYPWQMNLNTNVRGGTEPGVVGNTEAEDKAWTEITNETKEKNKLEKLEDYVSKDKGTHMEEARKMFEGSLWANINKYKNQNAYVQHFPQGKYISQVEDKVYRSGLPEYYIKLFPRGRYIDEANKKISALNVEEENELWAKIRDGWDLYIDIYLKKYPQGKFINQIEELIWQKALNGEVGNSPFKEKGFEAYLNYFPTGKYGEVAREKVKKYTKE